MGTWTREARTLTPQSRASSSEVELEDVSSAELDMVTPREVEEEELSQVTLIWRAIKLPLYSVAFIPLTVGKVFITFSWFFSRKCLYEPKFRNQEVGAKSAS